MNQETDIYFTWQDRDIRFDLRSSFLSCRKGERVIKTIPGIEDTKGSTDEKGNLSITNLRIIWKSQSDSNINISIGLNTIISLNIRNASSKIRGKTQALCIKCKSGSKTFDFVFTSLSGLNPQSFMLFQDIFRLYDASRMYRDIKLRGSLVKDDSLILLPEEMIFEQVNGVWNLSGEQGHLGCLIITNIRVVWFANLANNFNVSLPYLMIKSIVLKDSKMGKALVIETFNQNENVTSGEFMLGFKIDPIELLENIFRQIQSFHLLFASNPNFGVPDNNEKLNDDVNSSHIYENIPSKFDTSYSEYEDKYDCSQDLLYYSEKSPENLMICYNEQLGLAIENGSHIITLDQMWKIK